MLHCRRRRMLPALARFGLARVYSCLRPPLLWFTRPPNSFIHLAAPRGSADDSARLLLFSFFSRPPLLALGPRTHPFRNTKTHYNIRGGKLRPALSPRLLAMSEGQASRLFAPYPTTGLLVMCAESLAPSAGVGEKSTV